MKSENLSALGGFLSRRPKFAVAVWVIVMLVLGILGHGLGDEIEAHPLWVGGTGADQAHTITLHQFGSDESMVVVLQGPHAELERQGKELVSSLAATPKTLVISPWSSGGEIKGLRPNPRTVGIVVRIGHKSDETLAGILEALEGKIEGSITSPVKASITGLPKVFASFSQATNSASKTGEMIALPILLIVLLLVFRSVAAALTPIVIGAAVVSGTEGVLHLLLGVFQVDSFALGAAGMMGLAMGVDYSLLAVSRFRQEREQHDLATAVRTTVEGTGRSILPAGLGIIFAMGVASQILPGAAVKSSALAIMIATILSMLSALWVTPAVLMLLGPNLERWSLPRGIGLRGVPLRVANRVSRNPVALAALFLVCLFLAGWATTLKSTVASPQLLPPESSGRVQGEQIAHALGAGWLAPIEVVVKNGGEPMTSSSSLRSLVAFQDKVEGDRGVETMAGFRGVHHDIKPLYGFEGELEKQQHQVKKLAGGVSKMEAGAGAGVGGLREAALGAGELGNGAESAEEGAGLLAQGADRAHTGSRLLSGGIGHASEGSEQLAEGASKASSGSTELTEALEQARKQSGGAQGPVRATKNAMTLGEQQLAETQAPLASAEARLAAALQALENMTTGTSDPEYAAAIGAVAEATEALAGAGGGASVGDGITAAQGQFGLGLYLAEQIDKSNEKESAGVKELADASRKLEHAIGRLAQGNHHLSAGLVRLAAEGRRLAPALHRLGEGTRSLQSGLGELAANAGQLASGLDSGAVGQESLVAGLGRMGSRLKKQSSESELELLHQHSPHLFHSGYFYLAGLDGAPRDRRNQAGLLIDLERGGQTARMMVIPRYPATTPQGRETFEQVRDDAAELASKTGAQVVVGGLTASEIELDETLQDRSAIARIVLMFVTLVVLVLVLRALIVPIIAMFLNLLSVTVSLGLLSLLFNGRLLGGPGYVDAAVIPAAVMVMFGLALDYEVFLFARIREEYVRTGNSALAIENGLAQTAPVITGAAFIMVAVFLSFSVSSFITLRDFGVAEAAGVVVDAFVVRLIFVPAIMRALGPKWCWWMPKWLDRLIPGGSSPLQATESMETTS